MLTQALPTSRELLEVAVLRVGSPPSQVSEWLRGIVPPEPACPPAEGLA